MPHSGSSWGRRERGGEFRSELALPERSCLKKRLLCFTSELGAGRLHMLSSSGAGWLPILAQSTQAPAMPRRAVSPVQRTGSAAPGLQTSTAVLGAFTAGTNPRDSLAETAVSALPGENHTARITRLVFLVAAERRLRDPSHSVTRNRMGWGKQPIFISLRSRAWLLLVQASTTSRARVFFFCY